MMSLQMLTNEEKLRGLSQVMHGKEKSWFNNLEVANRQSWSRFLTCFVRDFKTGVSNAPLSGGFDKKVCIADEEVDSCDKDLTGFSSSRYECDDEDTWSDSSSKSVEDFVAYEEYWRAMLDIAYHAELQDVEDLLDERNLLSTSSSSEGEVEVYQDALSMQGVGKPCLDQHVEVHYRVLDLVCSRKETTLAIDAMEIGIRTAYESGITCKEEGTVNLASDEVWDQFLSCLSNDVVIEQVIEEQVADDCGDKEALPKLVLWHFNQAYDKQDEYVCFSMS
ncbi:hypothetical protein GOP47_0018185 [Adiantum capillus-veneris]|uniref:Uncharacterized protein n=1 Tax=Adiantum capillus-veneris TaxID=13818 RepID=A0A9D4ZBD2_ADICA|nr:hypothetical protein GOP47_0018185 [Adiantum capillus-veneris]